MGFLFQKKAEITLRLAKYRFARIEIKYLDYKNSPAGIQEDDNI